jgi:hypothetical protein
LNWRNFVRKDVGTVLRGRENRVRVGREMGYFENEIKKFMGYKNKNKKSGSKNSTTTC